MILDRLTGQIMRAYTIKFQLKYIRPIYYYRIKCVFLKANYIMQLNIQYTIILSAS
jgi:hypothetical protein